jgi:hypothetical protein
MARRHALTGAMLWCAGRFEAGGCFPPADDSSHVRLLEHRARRFYTPMSFVGIKREIDPSLEEQPTSQRKRINGTVRRQLCHSLHDRLVTGGLH